MCYNEFVSFPVLTEGVSIFKETLVLLKVLSVLVLWLKGICNKLKEIVNQVLIHLPEI